MKSFIAIIISLALSGISSAQPRPDGPSRDGHGGPGGPPDKHDGPGRDGDHDGPGRDGRGPGGPGMEGPGRDPFSASGKISQFDVFRGYMELVERYSRISANGGQAGVAAVVTAAEVLRPKGADAAIAFFTKELDKTKNAAVQRAIRMQLVDLYRSSGNADKALEQLDLLISGAPEGETMPSQQPPPGPGH